MGNHAERSCISQRMNFMPKRQKLIKDLTGGEEVNRNLFNIVKAARVLGDTPEINT